MPDIPTLTVTDASGTERGTIDGITAERSRHVTEPDRGKITVDRAKWQTLADQINERDDRFRIDAEGVTGWFGGRFRDTERGAQTVTVVLDDYERDARDGEPTGGQKIFQNVSDATVVQDALSRVPTLSAGTIETVASGVSFSFANASPAKMIRDAAEPGGALVRYNADRTVDFLAQPETAASWPTQTGSGSTTVDVSGRSEARIQLRAPPGGDTDLANGGQGGAVTVKIDTSQTKSLTIHGADSGGAPSNSSGGSGGAGLYNGGDGGGIASAGTPADPGAGGAGAVGVTIGGEELVIADGGGGAAGGDGGGGGGARGGLGGDSSDDGQDGDDAEGDGTGGDGGDYQVGTTPTDGENGSFEILDSNRVELLSDDGIANDSTGSVVYFSSLLSPQAGTLTDDASVTDDNRHPPTEIIGLGAQAGPNQVRASATVDPNAARDVYRKYENKDIQNADRLQTIVNRLANEVAEATEKIEVSGRGVFIDAAPGEPIPVTWDAEEIDDILRVVEFTEIVDSNGRRYEPIRVSNRWPEQGGADKRRADLERFNAGYQGFVDRDNFSIDAQPVTGSVNAEDSYFYPDDVIEEVRAEIRLRGRAYRAYSSGAAAGGQHTHEVDVGGTSDENTEIGRVAQRNESLALAGIDEGWQTLDTWSVPVTTSEIYLNTGMWDFINLSDGDIAEIHVRVQNTTTGEYFPNIGGSGIQVTRSGEIDNFGTGNINIGVPGDLNGEDLEAQVELNYSSGSGTLDPVIEFDWVAYDTHEHTYRTIETSTANGTHTHDPQPGLIEFSEYPSNVDVIVNGTSVGVSLGSGTGPFAETVDISGLLSPGDNQIEITSDTIGRVTGAVRTELFRQGPEESL